MVSFPPSIFDVFLSLVLVWLKPQYTFPFSNFVLVKMIVNSEICTDLCLV